jgi:hypothetical protein
MNPLDDLSCRDIPEALADASLLETFASWDIATFVAGAEEEQKNFNKNADRFGLHRYDLPGDKKPNRPGCCDFCGRGEGSSKACSKCHSTIAVGNVSFID